MGAPRAAAKGWDLVGTGGAGSGAARGGAWSAARGEEGGQREEAASVGVAGAGCAHLNMAMSRLSSRMLVKSR